MGIYHYHYHWSTLVNTGLYTKQLAYLRELCPRWVKLPLLYNSIYEEVKVLRNINAHNHNTHRELSIARRHALDETRTVLLHLQGRLMWK